MTCLNRKFAVRLTFAGVLAILAAGRPAAARADLCVPPTIPAGVADPGGTAFFATNAKGNLEAVDLKTGETLWESSDAYRPLAVAGKKLIAQANVKDKPNAIRLVLLDLENKGKLLKQSDDLVVAGPTDYDAGGSRGGTGGGDYRFSITAVVENGAAIVSLTSTSSGYRISGVPLPPEQSRWSSSAGGSWRLDLDSGQAKELTAWSHSDSPLPVPRAPSPDAGKHTESNENDSKGTAAPEVPESVKAASKGGAVWDGPWTADGKGCLLLLRRQSNPKDAATGTEEVSLHCWDVASGKAEDAVVLYDGPVYIGPTAGLAGGGAQRALDGRALLLTVASKDDQRVLLFAIPDGKRLADATLKRPAAVEVLNDGRTMLLSDPEQAILLACDTGKRLADLAVKGQAARVLTDGRRAVVIADQDHVVLLSAADGKQLAEVAVKGAALASRISDDRAVMIARPSDGDKNVQHVVLFSAAAGERLGELDVKCGKGLQVDQVVGVVGARVYTAVSLRTAETRPTPPGLDARGDLGVCVLTAYDASGGEALWQKTYSSRVYTPAPYLGPFPPSRPK